MSEARKVAVITGAGTGIGKAAAQALVKNGYCVTFAGRRAELLEKAAAECNAADRTLAVVTDVGQPESVKNLFAKTK